MITLNNCIHEKFSGSQFIPKTSSRKSSQTNSVSHTILKWPIKIAAPDWFLVYSYWLLANHSAPFSEIFALLIFLFALYFIDFALCLLKDPLLL